jgi:hypothetical protein
VLPSPCCIPESYATSPHIETALGEDNGDIRVDWRLRIKQPAQALPPLDCACAWRIAKFNQNLTIRAGLI